MMYLKYQCVRYFKLEGPTMVYCHSSGMWTRIPVCQGETRSRLSCGLTGLA